MRSSWHKIPRGLTRGWRRVKPNSIYHRCPSDQLLRTLLCRFSLHLFLRCDQDVFSDHTHVPHAGFIWKPKRRQISDYPVKGKGMQNSFYGLSRSSKGLKMPPSPVRGLLGTVNTTREGQWLPRFGKAGENGISTSGRHYAVAARGWDSGSRWRGSDCVCLDQAVFDLHRMA